MLMLMLVLMLASLVRTGLKVAAQNFMKSRSRDGLAAKGRAYSSYPTKAEFNNC